MNTQEFIATNKVYKVTLNYFKSLPLLKSKIENAINKAPEGEYKVHLIHLLADVKSELSVILEMKRVGRLKLVNDINYNII